VGAEYLGNQVDLELMSNQAASAQQQEQSVAVAAPAVTRQAAQLQTVIIGTHITNILFPPDFARALGSATPVGGSGPADKKKTSDVGTGGLAAGDAPEGTGPTLQGLSAWGDASLAWLDNTDAASKYDGLQKAGTLGTDYRFGDKLIAGVAFTPTQADLNLRSVNGNRDSTAISGTAYAGYKLDDVYAIQAMAGYGRAFNSGDQPVAGVDVKDNYDTNRYLAQIGLSAAYLLEDDLRVIPSLTYTQSNESASNQHSSDGAQVNTPAIRLGTVKAGAQVDYAVTSQIVPFVTGGVERDLINSGGSEGRQGYSVGGGVQAPIDDNLILGVVASNNFGRAAQSETQIAANIRYSW
jgi:outer membrane autotransporter protein